MKLTRIGREIAQHVAVYGGLFAFGWAYNQAIDWLHRRGYMDGFTWATVALGVLVTLAAAVPLIGLRAIAQLFAAFAASGAWMALGDLRRYWAKIENERRFNTEKLHASKPSSQTPGVRRII